jgi:hypothetical protein
MIRVAQRERRGRQRKGHEVATMAEDRERFVVVMGLAAIDLWSELPQEIQQNLFERAVLLGHKTERDESLREQLAQFLHANHDRTVGR